MSKKKHLRTGEVVEMIGCSPHQPGYVVRNFGLPSPRRSPGNQYLWLPADVRRVAKAVRRIRPYRHKNAA